MAEKKDKEKHRQKDKDKHKDNNLTKIKQFLQLMKDNELVELEIKHGDEKIFLKRSQPQPPALTNIPLAASPASAAPANSNTAQISGTHAGLPASETQPPEELADMKSPLVGTFYAAPSPDSEPYVEIGSHVTTQTVICIIEAMKVMNEIKADTNGTVVEILVKNGQAVEYGQVLYKVKPD